MPYCLRQTLSNHSSDVRAVCIMNNHKFVSSSRDKTSVIWETVDETFFIAMKTLVGGEHFINCVCVMPANESHPEGLIVTGTQDNKVMIYDLSSPTPINVCRGHTNAVSALCSLSKQTFASGSWDGTIKIWHIDRALCIATHTHHNGAVFSILKLSDNILLSAAADKLINVYKLPDIDILRGIAGHSDCVRGLAALDDQQFLSCSNDGTIRRWHADTGVSLGIVYTTDSFIYSITALRDSSLIACGCEDNKIVVIDKGQVQELLVPAISVWCVDIFPSRDILAATSDGMIRIFTSDPVRQADQDELKEFETSILIATGKRRPDAVEASDERTLENLPGPEALTKPGEKDGQILLVSEENKIICYQWSCESKTWLVVGDVTGVRPQASAKKILFENEQYDFVFDVDVEEGRPALKLPFSYGDNPYLVAESFLMKHNLPATYKMDIINFILKNVPSTSSDLSRVGSNKPKQPDAAPSFVYAVEHCILSKNIDVSKAKAKLIEFANINSHVTGAENIKWVDDLVEMAMSDAMPTEEALAKVRESLKWPADQIYPILDLLRVAVTNLQSNTRLCSENSNINIVELFRTCAQETSSLINNMLLIRLVANMVIHEPGRNLAFKHINMFIEQSKVVASKGNKMPALEVALANFIVNTIVIHLKTNKLSKLDELISCGVYFLERVRSKEAMCRIIAGLGTAVLKMDNVTLLQSKIDYLVSLTRTVEVDELSLKLRRVSQDLLKILKSKLLLQT